ncbi:MAG: FAD-binding protein [Acidimicrobiales bacterium]
MADADSAPRRLLTGWGRTAPTTARVVAPVDPKEVLEAGGSLDGRGIVARGLGRSYGDAAQNAGGTVLDMTGVNRIHHVDLDHGTADVDAGVSIDRLLRLLVPVGWIVPVLPGTRLMTIGGAIASDIHGKNHHRHGSFCRHVVSFDLLTADGAVRTVSPDDDAELFWATAGGMGLTGIVVRATVRLHPIETSSMLVDVERASDLDDLLARLASSDHRYTYSVAWTDLLARGRSLGRSVVARGWHASLDDLPPRRRRDPLRFDPRARLAAPPLVPGGLLNRVTVSAFNELWFRKAPRASRRGLQTLSPYFFPLDSVAGWNRVYGPRGFLQYQFVVPFGAERELRTVAERLSASGHASFLAVLKRFGEANPGPLSFPMPGWTLAVDLPAGRRAASLAALLDELDELVASAGGRVYLSKDSRLRPELLPDMYPRLDEWRAIRDRVDPEHRFRSDLARRLSL